MGPVGDYPTNLDKQTGITTSNVAGVPSALELKDRIPHYMGGQLPSFQRRCSQSVPSFHHHRPVMMHFTTTSNTSPYSTLVHLTPQPYTNSHFLQDRSSPRLTPLAKPRFPRV
ncbi:hypothetical protein BU23DRAFT_554350, partial [Bimuria novae-zelandiae CBS 107.79]